MGHCRCRNHTPRESQKVSRSIFDLKNIHICGAMHVDLYAENECQALIYAFPKLVQAYRYCGDVICARFHELRKAASGLHLRGTFLPHRWCGAKMARHFNKDCISSIRVSVQVKLAASGASEPDASIPRTWVT